MEGAEGRVLNRKFFMPAARQSAAGLFQFAVIFHVCT